jgi:hypothetical protein
VQKDDASVLTPDLIASMQHEAQAFSHLLETALLSCQSFWADFSPEGRPP